MRSRTVLLVMWMTILSATGFLHAQEKHEKLPVLERPFLGQKRPGMFPEMFAPGIISTGLHDVWLPGRSLHQ